jgi:L-lactate utilization protein LutB
MIKTAQDIKSYKKELKEALCDQFLRTALDNFNTAYRENRSAVYEGIDFEGVKKDIAAGKDAALPRLLDLFEEFKTHAESTGVKVHTAKDAKQANEIIAAIAKENNVKKIIKSKSMTAEETFLNDHLEKEGYIVTETDLGEWIIQLRKE